MKFLRTASLALLLLACSTTSPSDALFDGSASVEAAGWVSSGDPSMVLTIKRDSAGDPALSVEGGGAAVAVFSLPVDGAANSVGVTFRIRGSDPVRFSVSTLGTISVDAGGSCPENCSLHGAALSVTPEWTVVTLSWASLAQAAGSTPVTLDPANITFLNWEIQSADAYNVWVDDVAFVYDSAELPVGTGGAASTGGATSVTGGAPATGGDAPMTGGASTGGTTNPTNNLALYVDEAMFNAAFPERNGAYTYANLVAAVDLFPEFASCCSEQDRKREIAAFLAQVQHEADALKATDEYGTHEPSKYCNLDSRDQNMNLINCNAGQSYHGRGALQLTWNYNYKFAETYFASIGKTYNLWANPAQVSTNGELLWATGLWFWMIGDPSFTNAPHTLINSQGFGATIRKINGALECDGANPSAVTQRVSYYQSWCARLGVDPGTNLTC